MRRLGPGPGAALQEHRLSPEPGTLEVGAPFDAWVWPLDQTPDPAFASGAVGPGLALDPLEGLLRAPFAGAVTTLPASAHAAAVRHASGVEVLVHVGIDTVTLGGAGFAALVASGDAVEAAQPLIRFDLDAVARAGRSLVSPVVVLQPAGGALRLLAPHRQVAAGEPVFVLSGLRPAPAPHVSGQAARVLRLRVGLAEGLHARPAAALARIAEEAGVEGALAKGEAVADLRSVAALMSLAVGAGDRIELRLFGAPSEAAVQALAQALQASPVEISPAAEALAPSRRDAEGALLGLRAAPGTAVGPAFRRLAPAARAPGAPAGDPDAEARALVAALEAAAHDLAAEARAASGPAAQLLEAHAALARDPVLRGEALQRVAAGASAGGAWSEVADLWAERFSASGQARLAARAADLADVGARVLRALAGEGEAADPPAGALVLARDLAPSEVPRLIRTGVAGIALAAGGALGHAALLAQAAGLPMLVQAGAELLAIADGATLLLDADQGALHVDPSPARLRAEQERSETRRRRRAHALALAAAPARSLDGAVVAVLANLGAPEEGEPAVRLGAEGCGLLRTEFLFLRRPDPPSREAQAQAYAEAAQSLGGRPLTLRLLDAGADKALAWLPAAAEPNPALGRRGVRLLLARPQVLETQLRAIAALDPAWPITISVPMLERAGELRAIRRALAQACRAEGRAAAIPLGAMVETPAAVFGAAALAAEADFLSIGSNDLAQYVLARDREGDDPPDALDPAVLAAIAAAAAAAGAAGKPVTLCGAAASDPVAVPVMLGLGLRRLSCTPSAIPGLKALIRALDLGACEALAREALQAGEGGEVRALVRRTLPVVEEVA